MGNSTINYYNNNAKIYFDMTVYADMSKQYDMFLKRLEPNSKILDFGCGSGRDTKYFLEKGYNVDAIDGSLELCKLASEYTKTSVKCMDFNDLSVKNYYDGVWACSSLLHIQKSDLKNILIKVRDSLKEKGIFYSCFKDGNTDEYIDGRYYNYLTIDEYINIVCSIGFNVLEVTQSISVVKNNDGKIWNNFILRK